MTFKKTVVGIFDNEIDADHALSQLLANGFSNDDISALVPKRDGAHMTLEKKSKAPEGAVAGASTGALAGGVLGALVGVGAITLPGLGLLIAAGPILAALSGVAAGATFGGVAGGLVGLGVPEIEAKRYEDHVRGGGILVVAHVETADDLERARQVLSATGAGEVTAVGEKSRREKDDADARTV